MWSAHRDWNPVAPARPKRLSTTDARSRVLPLTASPAAVKSGPFVSPARVAPTISTTCSARSWPSCDFSRQVGTCNAAAESGATGAAATPQPSSVACRHPSRLARAAAHHVRGQLGVLTEQRLETQGEVRCREGRTGGDAAMAMDYAGRVGVARGPRAPRPGAPLRGDEHPGRHQEKDRGQGRERAPAVAAGETRYLHG